MSADSHIMKSASVLWPYLQDLVALVDEQLRIAQISPALQRLFFQDHPLPQNTRLSTLLLNCEVHLLAREERWQHCQARDVQGRLHDLEWQMTPLKEQPGLYLARFRKPAPDAALQQALQHIYQRTACDTGQAFLDSLVQQLCRELVVEGAFVAQWDDHHHFQLRAGYFPTGLAVDVQWLDAVSQPLLKHCTRLDGEMLPKLAEAGVDVLKSVPLRSADGIVWGVLAVLDRDRSSLPAWTEDLLVWVSSRCVSEMERVQAEQRMEQLAYYDTLTELPNRQRFTEWVNTLLTEPEQCRNRALVFLDLDRFKLINDTLGHLTGDRLIQLAARRLKRCLDAGSQVFRISGDEFAILTSPGSHLNKLLERLVLAFDRPFQLEGHTVSTTASMGVARWREEYRQAHDWLRDADQAMYAAKKDAHQRIRHFDDALWARMRARTRVQKQLEQARENDELFLQFQPVYALQEARLRGFEALIRWQHPEEGVIGPDRFIPYCEESGRILQLDRWVYRQVCRHLAQWREQHGEDHLLPVNVNVSASQVCQPDFVDYYLALLTRFDLEPELIHLEITETALMEEHGAGARHLEQLRSAGLRIVVDDFGMGYSSLGRLRHLPVDVLKIDRSFIEDMLESEEAMEVVWAIVTLAHNMGKRIVAEGIENTQQKDLLQTMRCDFGQGFLLGRPCSAEAAAALLDETGKQVATRVRQLAG